MITAEQEAVLAKIKAALAENENEGTIYFEKESEFKFAMYVLKRNKYYAFPTEDGKLGIEYMYTEDIYESKLNEAVKTLNGAGFICESLDELPLTDEEQTAVFNAIKSSYTRVKLTKSKGIRVDHLGEPMWIRIWKNAKNTYKFAVDYVSPDGMFSRTEHLRNGEIIKELA